jgi:hypothetical protein
LYSSVLLQLLFCTPPAYCYTLVAYYFSLGILLTCIDAAQTHHRKHMSCDCYPASPLVRWLLPSNSRPGPKENMLCDCYPLLCDVTTLHSNSLICGHKENTVPVLLASCMLRALSSCGSIHHNIVGFPFCM